MTESGVNYSLERAAPGQEVPFRSNENCNCSECPFMRLNTLEKLRDALLHLEPRVELSADMMRPRAAPDRAYAGCQVSIRSSYRRLRPRPRQPAHQRYRPLQYPLLLLHAGRGRAVHGPRARSSPSRRSSASCASAATLGVTKLRITGGEPLVRRDLPRLIEKLAAIPGIRDIALTTNAVLLEQQAQALYDAGLRRLNIHLDTLDRERFKQITRRDDLPRVLAGIDAAVRVGFDKIKLNIVAVKNLVEPDIVPMARFCRERGFEPRYIEFMPLDAQSLWDRSKVLTADEIIATLSREIAPLVEVPDADPRAPATEYRICGRRRDGGLHRLRQQAVLPELQPAPADVGRASALLPVRHRRDGCEAPAACGRAGRGHCRRDSAERVRKVDWP